MFLPSVIAVSCYFERRRALATGVAVCGAGVGCFVFAPAGNYMLEVLDWKNSMLVIAAITAHGAVLGMLFRPLPDPSTDSSHENNNLDNRCSKSSLLLLLHYHFCVCIILCLTVYCMHVYCVVL